MRQLGFALLSAACPGIGDMLLGRIAKGMLLTALFAALLSCFWPLRLLRYYTGFLVLFGSWFALTLYACCSVQCTADTRTERRPSKWWFALTLPLSLIIVSIAGGAVTRISGFRSFQVPSTSMESTIQRGDRIVVDARAYAVSPPQYRDVIVIYKDGTFFVKRLIGMSGDTVEGKNGGIILNGNLLNESYVQHSRAGFPVDWSSLGRESMETFGPVNVGNGKYFVLGDNRDVSLDSRSPEFGLIDQSSVVGKVLYIYNAGRDGLRVR